MTFIMDFVDLRSRHPTLQKRQAKIPNFEVFEMWTIVNVLLQRPPRDDRHHDHNQWVIPMNISPRGDTPISIILIKTHVSRCWSMLVSYIYIHIYIIHIYIYYIHIYMYIIMYVYIYMGPHIYIILINIMYRYVHRLWTCLPVNDCLNPYCWWFKWHYQMVRCSPVIKGRTPHIQWETSL